MRGPYETGNSEKQEEVLCASIFYWVTKIFAVESSFSVKLLMRHCIT
jgi:hypothetical protein